MSSGMGKSSSGALSGAFGDNIEVDLRAGGMHLIVRPGGGGDASLAFVTDRLHHERVIDSIRRESLDHVVVLGERHLRHLSLLYGEYHNRVRTHLTLNKMRPLRALFLGQVVAAPILGGLHHEYAWI
jgi:hypothetical protein